jgi:hypothetical protein
MSVDGDVCGCGWTWMGVGVCVDACTDDDTTTTTPSHRHHHHPPPPTTPHFLHPQPPYRGQVELRPLDRRAHPHRFQGHWPLHRGVHAAPPLRYVLGWGVYMYVCMNCMCAGTAYDACTHTHTQTKLLAFLFSEWPIPYTLTHTLTPQTNNTKPTGPLGMTDSGFYVPPNKADRCVHEWETPTHPHPTHISTS